MTRIPFTFDGETHPRQDVMHTISEAPPMDAVTTARSMKNSSQEFCFVKVLRSRSLFASALSTRRRSRWARMAPPDVAQLAKVVEGDHVVAAECS